MHDSMPPVKDQFAQLQGAMEHGVEVLGQMADGAQRKNVALTEGVDAVATVTGARQTGMFVSHNPVVELDLLVMMPGGLPIPLKMSQTVPMLHLSRVQPGGRLPVKVDPNDVNNCVIDWNAPPPE